MVQRHETCPADAVESTYFNIYRDRMADLPIHNPALSVEAVDFQLWQGHWLGVIVTPWCMSLLLLPGQEQGWDMPGPNQRRFVTFPVGTLAFLGNDEAELGEYQSCALFATMGQFASQADALQAARSALLELFKDPNKPVEIPAQKPKLADNPPLSRRQLFGLG